MAGILLGPRYSPAGGGGSVSLGSDNIFGPGAIVAWQIRSTGFVYYFDTFTKQGQAWINPQVGMELYECKADLEPGSNGLASFSSATGVWIPCSSGPQWGYNSSLPKMGQLNVSIRRIADGAMMVTDVPIYLETAGSTAGGEGGGGGGPLP